MKKNGLLTFIFACIPGAGQMYYGYMRRGLSLITLFCVAIACVDIFYPVMLFAPIIWMYSFFDTYDLIRNLVKGEPKQDDFLLPGDASGLKNVAINHNKIIGWVFIGLGAWALYDNFISPMFSSLLEALGIYDGWRYLNQIPTLVIAVLLVVIGVKLLGVTPGKKQSEDIPPYPTGTEGSAHFDAEGHSGSL